MRSRLILVALSLVAGAVCARVASAAAVDYLLQLEGIPGESSPPGLPDATQIHSLTVMSGAFAATQLVDSTHSQLAAAQASATLINNAVLGFYNDPNAATRPDATLPLHDVLVTSIQSTTIGPNLADDVSYQFLSPSLSLFLALPGISGESSPPGRPDVIAIDSLTITGNTFSVHKAVDSTSPALSSALVSAHDFSSASLLLYSSIATETQPDFALVFDHALISSIASDSSGERLSETVSFEAAGSSVLAPEPELWSALGAAAALLAAGRLRRASAQRRWN